MDWQTFLNQMNTEYKDSKETNPQVEIYDTYSGDKYEIVLIYNEDGALCIDIKKER